MLFYLKQTSTPNNHGVTAMRFDLTPGNIQNLTQHGATTIHEVLSPYEIARLIELSRTMKFVPQSSVGNVVQNFAKCGEFKPASVWWRLARNTAESLQDGFSELGWQTNLYFNDLSLQHYLPSTGGISPHRDQKQFIGLIALYILQDGGASFCLCDDKEGSNPRPVDNQPGDLILLRGSWPRPEVFPRPHHFVGPVKKERLTFGLRQFRDDSPLF